MSLGNPEILEECGEEIINYESELPDDSPQRYEYELKSYDFPNPFLVTEQEEVTGVHSNQI